MSSVPPSPLPIERSTTLKSVGWQNTTLISGDFVQQITKLKEQPGKNIGISGSGTLIGSLLRARLLDELSLLLHPVVVGAGNCLFEDPAGQVPLKLIESRTFDNGVIALRYQTADT